MAPMMMLAPAAASFGASASWAWSGQAWPSVPQCMDTMTVGASRRAARTAARLRGMSIALASPGRLGVAAQDEASSATCETPTTANLTPLMVLTYGAHAAAALVPIPTYGTGRPGRLPACPPARRARSPGRGCSPS